MTKYSSSTILRALICFSLLRAGGTFSNIDLSTQTLDPATTGFMMTGNSSPDYFGISVSTAGDINNDGYDDIIVGAFYKYSNKGAAYLIYCDTLFLSIQYLMFDVACSTCVSCPTNCNTCTSASTCTGRTSPYLLYQSQCLSSCPAGTFVSSNICQGKLIFFF